MREIKFRGKRIDNNEWVCGNLIVDANKTGRFFIIECGVINYKNDDNTIKEFINNYIEIMPETIGQFTGLYDKNGVEIYEGDIIKSLINTFEIVFKKGCFFAVGINRKQEYTLFEEFEMCNKANVNLEVIGNIYDNEVEE